MHRLQCHHQFGERECECATIGPRALLLDLNPQHDHSRRYQPDADKDALRFASMSVTRNPTGALIPNDRKEIRPRVSEPLEGLQRVRVARAPPGPEQDVEGSHPRPLHVASTGHRDPLDTTDISGTQTRSRMAGLVTTREVNPLSPTYVLPGSTRPQAPHEVPPFKRDLGAVDDIPGAKPTPLYADRPVRLSVRCRAGRR